MGVSVVRQFGNGEGFQRHCTLSEEGRSADRYRRGPAATAATAGRHREERRNGAVPAERKALRHPEITGPPDRSQRATATRLRQWQGRGSTTIEPSGNGALQQHLRHPSNDRGPGPCHLRPTGAGIALHMRLHGSSSLSRLARPESAPKAQPARARRPSRQLPRLPQEPSSSHLPQGKPSHRRTPFFRDSARRPLVSAEGQKRRLHFSLTRQHLSSTAVSMAPAGYEVTRR